MNEPRTSATGQRPHWLNRGLALDARDPIPLEDAVNFWRATAQAATLIICVLMLGAFLYVARSLLLPVLCAFIVGMTFGPYIGLAVQRGVPAWVLAIGVLLLLIGLTNAAVILLANPLTEMLRKAPEIAAALKDKMHVFDRPLLALYELQAALGATPQGNDNGFNVSQVIASGLAIVTPAAAQFVLQLVLFLGTLFFFIVGRASFRRVIVNRFSTRDARLRTLKIINDIEENLSGYLVVVTVINLGLGIVTVGAAYAMGLPYPLLWGALAFALNYIPYIGSGINCILLFGVGLLTYPTLLGALMPPLVFLIITTIEGQFITPAVVGQRVLLVHPLAIFLAIAFWAWLWGPLGAFIATPILIVARAAIDHLYPKSKAELPE